MAQILVSFSFFAILFSPVTRADSSAPWWKKAVFYEIYIRSFADSNGDGLGDINGITGKLDYLKDLGVDALWITPCFPSPQVDFGYDVSDFRNIDPQYGSLSDFDRMVREAKKRGIRIILDLVLNHTSDQHPWFIDAKSSSSAQHRDWYIWRNAKKGSKPPNNWRSAFGGSAWKQDPVTKQFYYHMFYPQQPDLNWRNPAVNKAMFDVTTWWYERGVDGFRLDAVDTLFEDPKGRDNPPKAGINKLGDPEWDAKYTAKLPEVHDVLRDLRKVADRHHAVLIGETWTHDIDELKRYYGKNSDGLHMPMDLMFAIVNKFSARAFRKQIAEVNATGEWPVFVLGNHDLPRASGRYGDGKNDEAIAKVMAALYLTLRGTPILYYGEEIAMVNNDPTKRDEIQDPIGKIGWPKEKGRDGERTPMQWSSEKNAGFTTGAPWLPIPASARTRNVAVQSKDPESVLGFYRELLRLRHQFTALQEGTYAPLDQKHPAILAYLRKSESQTVLVALNMSAKSQQLRLDLRRHNIDLKNRQALLSWVPSAEFAKDRLLMPPFGVYIASIGSAGLLGAIAP